MPFMGVNTVAVRPDRMADFERNVAELADEATNKEEQWRWTAHQPQWGEIGRVHFVYTAADFAELERFGSVADLYQRTLGEPRGREAFAESSACLQSVRHTLAIDRPDLSYAMDGNPTEYPWAVVTELLAKPGAQEACEELIRKVAEAIPKVSDPSHLMTFQTMFGDMRLYTTVRPVKALSELDSHAAVPELLDRAFGAAEGGLIFRSGTEAIEDAHRELVVYRSELSNPPQS